MGGDNHPREARRDIANRRSAAIPLGDPATEGMSAADHHIEVLCLERREHLRQQGLVVLQIGVDHREIRGATRKHSLDDRGRQAAAANPL